MPIHDQASVSVIAMLVSMRSMQTIGTCSHVVYRVGFGGVETLFVAASMVKFRVRRLYNAPARREAMELSACREVVMSSPKVPLQEGKQGVSMIVL